MADLERTSDDDDTVEYGVRVTHVTWATLDGGDDLVGDRVELESKVERWRAEDDCDETIRIVRYEVVPYVPRGLVMQGSGLKAQGSRTTRTEKMKDG